MNKRIVVGIAGASGVIYGVKLLGFLKEKGIETHLIISESGERNIEIETDYKAADVKAMADYCYDNRDVGASLASGSFFDLWNGGGAVHHKDPFRNRQLLYRQPPCQGRGRALKEKRKLVPRGQGNPSS